MKILKKYSRVDLLPLAEHGDVFLDAPCAGLGLLGFLDAVEDGVAVGAVEDREELAGALVLLQLALEVRRHRRGPLALVGGGPAAVRLRALDLAQARRAHLALLDQCGGLVDVDLRPFAARLAGGEALQPVAVVERPLVAVAPAEAEGDVERLRVGDRGDTGALLGELDPQAARGRVVVREPRLPLRAGGEG